MVVGDTGRSPELPRRLVNAGRMGFWSAPTQVRGRGVVEGGGQIALLVGSGWPPGEGCLLRKTPLPAAAGEARWAFE